MEEYTKYDAFATTQKDEDELFEVRGCCIICENNKEILRRLKENDPELKKVWICNNRVFFSEYHFHPDDGEELGWLGYFIGKNTSLQKLIITYLPPLRDNGVEAFREGVGRNKSIRSISFDDCDRSGGHIFKSFDQFFKILKI